MSSLAFPRAAARRHGAHAVSAAIERLGAHAVLVVAVLTLATVMLIGLPGNWSLDSWLALTTGREVWHSGIPQHETLTALSHGAPWIDQQWLAQLMMYALYLAGGFGLVGLVNVSLLVGGLGGAIVAAQRLGAPVLATLALLPLCGAVIVPSGEVRTQTLAIPLFVALVYLLAQDARSPSRRVYWCLPILVLWANLHGTVSAGVMIVVLRGLTLAFERRRSLIGSPRSLIRPLALVLGAPLALLLTPYGLRIVGYYHTMLLGSTLRHAVSEWQPITSVPSITVALLAVAAIAVWALGRSPASSTLWERLALLALTVGSIAVVRNALFFGLFALAVVPVWLHSRERRSSPAPLDQRRVIVNGALIAATLAAVLIASGFTLARPAAAYEFHFERRPLLSAVEHVTRADPSLKVLADADFGDWLLWRDPGLDGRVAYDTRYELLSAVQMGRLENLLSVTGLDWKQSARGYRLLVLDRLQEPVTVRAFLAEPGHRVLYDDGERLVILRSVAAAAQR